MANLLHGSLALAFACAPAAAVAAPVEGRIMPPNPFVEDTASGPSVSFDIVLRNEGEAVEQLAEVEVTFLDKAGTPLLTRRVDGNGGVPSIATLGDLKLPAKGERLFFNPFQALPIGLDPHRVSVRVTFGPGVDIAAPAPVLLSATLRRPAAPARLILPIRGKVLVWDGHDALSHHRRWDYMHPYLRSLGFGSNAMRYSYDLVPLDKEGRSFVGDEAKNESYPGFGMAVRAPAAGVIAATVGDRPDDHSFNPEESKTSPNALFGNYVIIDHENGSFSMLAHVKQNSVKVRQGERVKAGQVVAAIGASGSSLFPHLHYQLVDGPTMSGEGIPSYFRGLKRLRGTRAEDVPFGQIDSGDIVVGK